MKKFIILDTGVYRADPYVIVNELQEAVAQSVEKNGGHYAHGLREITDYIASLESRLREAEKLGVVAESVNLWLKRSNMGGTAHQRELESALAAFLAGGE